MRRRLQVPPLPNVTPAGVFDAYGWCESRHLEVLLPDEGLAEELCIGADNPPGFAFVFRGPTFGLPHEPGELHLPGLLETGSQVLAPYAIDDATDGLYEQRLTPSDVFFLAVTRMDALHWGLHDWCHFHNHGPFEQRAWTELGCDRAATRWLQLNAHALGIEAAQRAQLESSVRALCTQRFADEGILIEVSADWLPKELPSRT